MRHSLREVKGKTLEKSGTGKKRDVWTKDRLQKGEMEWSRCQQIHLSAVRLGDLGNPVTLRGPIETVRKRSFLSGNKK